MAEKNIIRFTVSKTKGPHHVQGDVLNELVTNEVTRDAVTDILPPPKPGIVTSAAVR